MQPVIRSNAGNNSSITNILSRIMSMQGTSPRIPSLSGNFQTLKSGGTRSIQPSPSEIESRKRDAQRKADFEAEDQSDSEFMAGLSDYFSGESSSDGSKESQSAGLLSGLGGMINSSPFQQNLPEEKMSIKESNTTKKPNGSFFGSFSDKDLEEYKSESDTPSFWDSAKAYLDFGGSPNTVLSMYKDKEKQIQDSILRQQEQEKAQKLLEYYDQIMQQAQQSQMPAQSQQQQQAQQTNPQARSMYPSMFQPDKQIPDTMSQMPGNGLSTATGSFGGNSALTSAGNNAKLLGGVEGGISKNNPGLLQQFSQSVAGTPMSTSINSPGLNDAVSQYISATGSLPNVRADLEKLTPKQPAQGSQEKFKPIEMKQIETPEGGSQIDYDPLSVINSLQTSPDISEPITDAFNEANKIRTNADVQKMVGKPADPNDKNEVKNKLLADLSEMAVKRISNVATAYNTGDSQTMQQESQNAAKSAALMRALQAGEFDEVLTPQELKKYGVNVGQASLLPTLQDATIDQFIGRLTNLKNAVEMAKIEKERTSESKNLEKEANKRKYESQAQKAYEIQRNPLYQRQFVPIPR